MFLEEIHEKILDEFKSNGLEVFDYPKYGDITFNIDASIYIDHIKNFSEVLTTLADTYNSPIADDGYTGIDIFKSLGGDSAQFIIDGFLFFDYENNVDERIVSFFTKEGIPRQELENIMDKCRVLQKIGFDSVTFISSCFHADAYENRQLEIQKRLEEDAEEHYTIEDYL